MTGDQTLMLVSGFLKTKNHFAISLLLQMKSHLTIQGATGLATELVIGLTIKTVLATY